MKICIVYAGEETRPQGLPSARTLALQRVAGGNVVGHVLNQLKEAPARQLVLVVEGDSSELLDWFAKSLPEADVQLVTVAVGTGFWPALTLAAAHFDQEAVLLVPGNYISEADYTDLEKETAEIVLVLPPQQAKGMAGWSACYFRQGHHLRSVLETLGQAEGLAALVDALRMGDISLGERLATLCLDTRTPAELLEANARLLGLGYGSEDAIERSYVEDFTVVPPVYLHETAYIENAVVGPFANIEAGAEIHNSVVRNSLIGAETVIENAVLDGSLVGERAAVRAAGHAVIADDEAEVTLT